MRWWLVVVTGVVLGVGGWVGTAQGEACHVEVPACLAGDDHLLSSGLSPTPPAPRASWIHFGGFKSRVPKLSRSEAGLTLSLGSNVAVQLHYERTALAPMMHHDHDDGILTRLRFGF